MTEREELTRPYVFDGEKCSTLVELVTAMAPKPAKAQEHLLGGYIGKWIEHTLGDIDAKIDHDRLLGQDLDPRQKLYTFLAAHWKDGAPPFMGVAISWEQLEQIALDQMPEGLPKRQFVCDIHRLGILPLAAKASGDERLLEVDERWQREFLDYCVAHAEVLSYEEIWNNRGGALELCLADPHSEAFYIAHFMNGQRDAWAARKIASSTKVQIFDALFDPELAARCRFDREAESTRELLSRSWFAALLKRYPEPGLGIDLALGTASMIAAGEVGAIARSIETNKAEIEAAGKDWPLPRLSQKGHAILYGGAMALASLMGIWAPNGWTLGEQFTDGTMLALGVMSAYFATLYAAMATERRTGVMLSIAILVLMLGTIPISFFASGWWVQDAPFFGLIFAALGFARHPLIAAKQKEALGKKERDLAMRLTGSPDREEDPDVVIGYLDFYAEGVPRDQIVAHSRHERVADYAGAMPTSGTGKRRERSTPAAYQSEGLSYGVAGMNVASDGAITSELVDGVSVDTKGRVNTRIADGVTLHSDGKTTTRVTDGVDVRSDGQVSVEMFGMRHSWGGKKDDKKKDSWF